MKKLFFRLVFVVMALSLGYLLLDKFAPEQAEKIAEKTKEIAQNVQEKIDTEIADMEKDKTRDSSAGTAVPDLDPSEYASGEISESVDILDDTWSLYKNTNLGFSIKIPNNVTITKCKDELVRIEVGVMAYADETSGYILNSDRYDWATCTESFNSFEDVLAKKVHHWKITPKTINDENELNAFMKEIYGEGCVIENLDETEQNGVYDVKLIRTDPEGGCFVNWASVFKYYPEGNKVVQWNLGQDTNFWDGDGSYDKAMSDSFRFLTNGPEENLQAYINTDASSNIPLIIAAENGESLTVFKNFAGNKEYIEKVVVQTADGKMAVINSNFEGLPTSIESGTYRATYTNYNLEESTVDIDVYLNGVHNSHKGVKLDLPGQTAQVESKNMFIPSALALPVFQGAYYPPGVDPYAQPEEKEDFFIGTAGQIWSVVSCGGGIGLTAISGGAASPMLYLSCGVLLTRVVTSNMEIGPCSGDVMECAKDAVVDVFTHDGPRQYTHEVIEEDEEPQPEIILDLEPVINQIVTNGVYQSPIQRTKDNNGLADTISGSIQVTSKNGVGSCEMSFDSKASGVPNIPGGADLPAGVTMPSIDISSKVKSTSCSGTVDQSTGKFALKGSANMTSTSGGINGDKNGPFSINGQIVGTGMNGKISFGETGDVIDF